MAINKVNSYGSICLVYLFGLFWSNSWSTCSVYFGLILGLPLLCPQIAKTVLSRAKFSHHETQTFPFVGEWMGMGFPFPFPFSEDFDPKHLFDKKFFSLVRFCT